MKRDSTSLMIKEILIKTTTLRYHFHLPDWQKSKSWTNIFVRLSYMAHTLLEGMWNGKKKKKNNPMEIKWKIFTERTIAFTIWKCINRYTCTWENNICTSYLLKHDFLGLKIRDNLSRVNVGTWLNRCLCIYAME